LLGDLVASVGVGVESALDAIEIVRKKLEELGPVSDALFG
jgi:hypothetical protein